MPIEVTWTDDDYDDEDLVLQQKPSLGGQGQDDIENLSRGSYSGDDEYEEDEDIRKKQMDLTKFEQQWQQLNAINNEVSTHSDQREMTSLQNPEQLQPEEQPEEGQEQPMPMEEGQMGERKPPQSPLVAVEATYTGKLSTSKAPREEDSFLCGLAAILLDHCDPRGTSQVEDATTQVTLITEDDLTDPTDPMVDTSAEWENPVTQTKGEETQDMALKLIPLEDQDNQSLDGSLRSTRTTATQETERTAIETEFAPLPLSNRAKSGRKSSFLKWSKKPKSSKKRAPKAPTIIPPVEKEPTTSPIAAVEKESSEPTPAPMEISTSSLDLQREISLLEFDDIDAAEKNMRIVGLSPTESFDDREVSVVSPTLETDDAASQGTYDDDDEGTLLSDPRNNHTYMVKPIQSIEVIYDPNFFDVEEEEQKDGGEGTRYCTLLPVGVKKSRGRFFR